MMDPLIITSAVIGAELTKDIYPNLPTTTDELAQSSIEAVKAGASIIHLHVRDKEGRPSQDPAIFKEITDKIKEQCNPIIQYSTGGAAGTHVEERISPLNLSPEMATLSMGTLNFGDTIFENQEYTITKISNALIQNNVMPELEIFDLGMMDTVNRFLKKELIPEKFHMDFVLGIPGGLMGTHKNLLTLVERVPEGQSWGVAGIGRFQLPLTAMSISMGGHVRVGLEDNIYYTKGILATSNAQFIERVVRIAKELDREVANPDLAREILKL